MKKTIQTLIAACLSTLCAFTSLMGCNAYKPILLKEVNGQAKNVILMIGDGMGPVQIRAGELFKGSQLCIQQFPYMTMVETRSHSDYITDSAAAGTAMATGVRTTNGCIGVNNDLEPLETIMDIAHTLGKRTGVLATEEITGATPMSFLSHASSRSNTYGLVIEAAQGTVDLVASYSVGKLNTQRFEDGGYTIIENVDDISSATQTRIFGSYNITAAAPSGSAGEEVAFDRLVTEALDYLSQDEDGFVLMAEGAHIDHGGHNNDIDYMLEELLAFDAAVRAVLEWAKDRDDTVVIVTADHETGGLTLEEDVTHKTLFDKYTWEASGHTPVDVNCYINGANIDFSQYSFGTMDRIQNADVFQIMKALIGG